MKVYTMLMATLVYWLVHTHNTLLRCFRYKLDVWSQFVSVRLEDNELLLRTQNVERKLFTSFVFAQNEVKGGAT